VPLQKFSHMCCSPASILRLMPFRFKPDSEGVPRRPSNPTSFARKENGDVKNVHNLFKEYNILLIYTFIENILHNTLWPFDKKFN
jgi:hypothetical protein